MSTSSINLTNSVLDVGTIVDNLIYADSAPVRNMQSQVTTLQSKVSAYQSLNTKLSTLSDKVNTLLFGDANAPIMQPYTFADRLSGSIFAKCGVSSSNDGAISATSSNATVGGTYSINVTSLAQAKSMASAGFADSTSAATGTGAITITTGANAPVTITINSSNSTLAGVRDAINNANAGVTATIVNDGTATPYKLLIRANDAGTANSFTVTDGLSGGQSLELAQTQAAVDAQLTVNGINITKSSNTISDVIDGVTFTLKDETTSPVTLTVDKDLNSIVDAFKEFVTAYNGINSFINSQFAYNTTTHKAGLLAGDSTLRRIQSNLQSTITQSISNRFTKYGVAGQIGLEFNRDGSLTLNETKLRDAMNSDFTGVAALFLGDGTPEGGASASDSRVSYAGKTAATQSGTYSIQVNTLAQQAAVLGTEIVNSLIGDETLTITSGTQSVDIPLQAGNTLDAVLLSINGTLSGLGIAARATNDGTNRIRIATTNYGSSQNVTVVSTGSGGSGTTGFGSIQVSGSGTDIEGTINGHAATGNGLTLTGAAGQPEEGLSLDIAQTTTGNYGTLTVASAVDGIEGKSVLMNLFSVMDGITDPLEGPIHNATDGLNRSIRSINDMISAYQDRLDKKKEMLTAEFSQADQALRLMTVTQSQLNGQIASLKSS
jgi:flagellar hook-associated protein 2